MSKKETVEHKRLRGIYHDMMRRCYCSSRKNYAIYGARGIKVCKAWRDSFECFKEWALCNGYANNLTIDRINVNKWYTPSNCRWVTQKTQCNNKRNNRLITYKGETKTLKQWSEDLNIPYFRLHKRISVLHLPIDEAFSCSDRRFKGGKICQK